MTPAAPLSLAERFALVIGGLCEVIGRRGRSGPAGPSLPGPLLWLIWGRLHRMAARFTRLAARGLIPSRPLPSRAAPLHHAPAPKPKPRTPLQPSRSFAALLRLIPETTQYTGQLQYLLNDPEMKALLAARPGFGRILRPLCRMLGIRATPALAAKPPVRHTIITAAATHPSPTPPLASPPGFLQTV